MLGGQAEAAVPWKGQGQRVGELHWAGRGVQGGGHQLEAKRVPGATLGPHTHVICTKFRSCPLTWSPCHSTVHQHPHESPIPGLLQEALYLLHQEVEFVALALEPGLAS